MKIGELAKVSGMAASRIRFYEATGLIEPIDRQANGYREYPSDALLILEIIQAAKRAGFSLEEIKPLLPSGAHPWNRENLVVSLEKKLKQIASLQQRLKRTKGDLLRLIAIAKERPNRNDCALDARKAVNAIRAASRRHKK